MRNLDADAAFVPDPDRFGDRGEQHRRLAADVREVKPVARSHRCRERDQLGGLGVRAGRIHEPRREAESPRVHRLTEQPLHRPEVVRLCRSALEAHRRDAHRAVPDEVSDVDGGMDRGERVEILRERLPSEIQRGADAARPAAHDLLLPRAQRRLGEGAHADDFGRHALADLRFRRRTREVEEVRVRVRVDEARRHDVSRGVDRPRRFATKSGPDGDDAIALDRHIRGASAGARSVDHRPAAEEKRPGHRFRPRGSRPSSCGRPA